MSTRLIQRHPSVRWLAPVLVLGMVGVVATGVMRARATSQTLPTTTPAALIAQARTPDLTGFSGVVVASTSLGLPDLPSFSLGGDSSSMTSLLSGSHTLQVWYGGADQQRVALLGATDETDLYRSGQDLWQWSSADRVAVHAVLPPETPSDQLEAPLASTTPSALATEALGALDADTSVRVDGSVEVANRQAYALVLTPSTGATRVGQIRVFIDGERKVPLGVQIYARGAASPAVDVTYSSIRFTMPSDNYFDFSPPTGATVHEIGTDSAAADEDPSSSSARSIPGSGSTATLTPSSVRARTSTVGAGWTRVWVYRAPHALKLGELGRAAQKVSGSWGTGRLVQTALVSALVTNTGRVYVGAVDPATLYAAAGQK